MPGPRRVTCVPLVDGKLSLRLHGHEVAILPNRMELTIDALERALNQLHTEAETIWLDDENDEVFNQAFDEVKADLGRWEE